MKIQTKGTNSDKKAHDKKIKKMENQLHTASSNLMKGLEGILKKKRLTGEGRSRLNQQSNTGKKSARKTRNTNALTVVTLGNLDATESFVYRLPLPNQDNHKFNSLFLQFRRKFTISKAELFCVNLK